VRLPSKRSDIGRAPAPFAAAYRRSLDHAQNALSARASPNVCGQAYALEMTPGLAIVPAFLE